MKQQKSEWHRIVTFGKLAEICGDFLKKGYPVYVCGSLKTRKWEDREGVTHYTTEIIAREMQMLSKKESEEPIMGEETEDVPF